MEIVNLLFVLIFINYVFFIGLLIWGFSKVKLFQKTNSDNKTGFSIVIPFRNEEHNLPDLLQSLAQLNYSKEQFELIFVDDNSKDNSVRVINQWRMENPWIHLTILDNVRVSKSPKKDAITRAVMIAKHPWIITTDADCMVKSDWLSVYDVYIQNNDAEMIAGAVNFPTKGFLLSHFQQMDMLSLQGASIGSFGLNEAFMCNGANFAYTKTFFSDLKGFHGNNHIASGDDVFLLQKAIANCPEKVHYLKNQDAIVTTKPEKSWFKLFKQRVRWASKATAYQSDFAKGLAILVFLANFTLLFGLLLLAFNMMSWQFLLALFSVKFIVDFTLMYQTNRFLKMRMYSVLISSLIYPFFSSLVALYSLVGGFEWKRENIK
ncbi:glycosyl transferase [Flavobacterium limnosediminis JC2902]|uniref:Glycosyl transferase n=1 Tax=Flavobacterium limnosediminis JC2902 TaxID=1341181 RepID=V6SU20_9FLAO|nr:glycosyltransferase [Flavobacterium limnosediminis]ESU29657.1 glycosyl transferase [Flavobacterium limnosediminis JC2902]